MKNTPKSQEQAVLKIFKDKKKLSASEAWLLYNKKDNTPITSIRRAITDLCSEGELVKTLKTKEGLYGKPEHIYKIVR